MESNSSWHSYSSIFNIGHAAAKPLTQTTEKVFVQEKIDGSQFSFGVFSGELRVRSKGVVMDPDVPASMFTKAIAAVRSVQDKLVEGWTYRGEFLSKPKHNVLPYGREPKNNIVLFDIEHADCAFLSPFNVEEEALRLRMDYAPIFYSGMGCDLTHAMLLSYLDKTSILGKCPIEGVVIKPLEYNIFGADKKVLMAKYVSEAFKEKHIGEIKNEKANSTLEGIANQLVLQYATPQRWRKAIQHLKENNQLSFEPKDIPIVMKEVIEDIEKDSVEEIKDYIYSRINKKLHRGFTCGVPEYYKKYLLERQFENEET